MWRPLWLVLLATTWFPDTVFSQQVADTLVMNTLNSHGDRISDLENTVKRLFADNQAMQRTVHQLKSENTDLKARVQTLQNHYNSCCRSSINSNLNTVSTIGISTSLKTTPISSTVITTTTPPIQTTTHDPNILVCSKCSLAVTKDNCTLVNCDRTIEDCYMDQLITETSSVVYEGGCRSKDVCLSSASSLNFGLGRKRDTQSLTSCSRCCRLDGCNIRLCGISSVPFGFTTNTPQIMTTTHDPNTLVCSKCHFAEAKDNCTLVNCDRRTEQCYMDQLITDSLSIVYVGGCRARDVCTSGTSSLNFGLGLGRKRSALTACSRCCKNEDACNRNLCSISTTTASPVKTTPTTPPTISNGQTTVHDPSVLVCLKCTQSYTQNNCPTVNCDRNTEECYTDQIITDQGELIYNGGCRSKDVCLISQPVGRKRELISCSRCCDSGHGCNRYLCGTSPGTRE